MSQHISAALFHRRRDEWAKHFRWSKNWRVIGLTPTGRATVDALAMNRIAVIAIRKAWAKLQTIDM
ncbi:MAG: hypothetical protein L0Y72_13640 [Gemmataceae bacterium]|nr:hypothetical protein [Gemmataceae bacterium]MCI0740083.1 hypothetical protein [Gemmataceae bacterium]